MSGKDDGGPAFARPSNRTSSEARAQSGMTLRDYFAAQAIAGGLGGGWTPGDVAAFARQCWAVADAMLAERAKKEGK